MRGLLLTLAASFALAGTAVAEEAANECMVSAPVTAANVEEAKRWDLTGFAGEGHTPAFILGGLSPMREAENAHDVHGAVLFQRNADGSWRAALPKLGEGAQGVYRATNSDAIIFVTMWQMEGPGQSWTVVTLRGADAKCVSVPFPESLNKPAWNNEFLELTDLDIGANGRGEMVGVARGEGKAERWYVYRTRDGGMTWGRPQELRRQRAARGGLFTEVPRAPAPAALAAELEAYAAAR